MVIGVSVRSQASLKRGYGSAEIFPSMSDVEQEPALFGKTMIPCYI